MSPLSSDINEISLTPIQRYYSGANVFITGGTGFLGQLIIEKLLRSCPDIGNIYILIREKKNKNIITRLDELLDGEVFTKLKETYPKYKYKIVPIEGDCSLPNLGINEQDKKLLTTEVSVVFHSAATVNFDEKLKKAIDINIRGTKEVIDLCKQMPHLKSVVHVSTAYSNCAEDVIEEVFYPVPIEPNNLLTIRNLLDDDTMEKLTPHFLRNLPNTYAFTKAIAEAMVQKEGIGLPIAIYRPAIIISTYKEPLEGWTNNLYGPAGITVGAATGLLKVAHCNPNVNANVIPADMCVNALLSLQWETDCKYRKAQNNKLNYEIPIYHYESSTDKPLSWRGYETFTHINGVKYPPINSVWYYCLLLIKNFRLYQIVDFFLHFLPAFFIDAILFILGKQRKFLKLYHKVLHFNEVISYFNTKTFTFKSTNVRNLISKMSPKDQDIFFCDLKKLDWDDYGKLYFKGIRLYLMKDPLTTLPQARKRYLRFYYAHQIIKILFGYAVFRIILSLVSFIISKIV